MEFIIALFKLTFSLLSLVFVVAAIAFAGVFILGYAVLALLVICVCWFIGIGVGLL